MVMIIAVLIAIAIPSFLGFRASAQDRAAQATLIAADKTARLIVIEDGVFPGTAASVVLLNATEPAFVWVEHKDPSTGPGVISVDEDNTGADLNFAVLSGSGTCWYLRVNVSQLTSERSFDTSVASCESHDFQNGADTGW